MTQEPRAATAPPETRLELDADGRPFVAGFRDGARPEAVLVVPGILCHRRLPELRAVAQHLAAARDVLVLDPFGHGESPGRFTWGREEWRQVRASAAWLERRGRRVDVLGFSFGGFHAVRAWTRGLRAGRMALVSAPVDFRVWSPPPSPLRWARHLPWMLRRCRGLPRLARPRGLFRDRHDVPVLAQVDVPALVVHAGEDWLVHRRHAEAYARGMPRASLVEIPGGLHAEYLMDSQPEAFLAVLDRFFGGGGDVAAG